MPLCKQIPDTVGSLQKSLEDLSKLKDASMASQYNGLFGIPIVDKLLNDSTSMVSSFLTDASAAGVSYITSAVNKKISDIVGSSAIGLSAALTGIVGIINLGAVGSLVLAAMLAQQLQKQLALRILYYQELLYHYQNIKLTLSTLKNTASPKSNNLRIKASRYHVQKAHIAALRLQARLRNLGVWDQHYHQIIFSEATLAEKYLTSFKELDNAFLLSLKANDKKSYQRLWKYLQTRFNKEVLGSTLHIVDSLFWHTQQIAFVLPIPFKQLLSPKGITAGLENRLPGYTSTSFNPTIESEKYDKFVEQVKKDDTFLNDVAAADTLKGLILTNLSVDGFLITLPNIKPLWNGLQTSAAGLYQAISPIDDILKSISDSMNESISKNDTDMALTFKIPLWVAELESVKQYQNTFAAAGNLQDDIYVSLKYLDALASYINETGFVDNDIPPLVIKSFRSIFLAPVSQLWLNEALTEINVVSNKLRNAIGMNRKLNSLCFQLVSKTSETVQEAASQFGDFSKSLSLLPGPAGSLGSSLLNGNIANVIGAMSVLSSTGVGVVSAVLDATKGCPSESTSYSPVMENQADIWWKNESTLKKSQIGLLSAGL